MAIAGLRGTGTWGTDKIERPTNFREMILWRSPNGSAPLTALLAKAKSEATDDPEFSWWEESQSVPRMALSTQLTNTATSAVFTTTADYDAYSFVANDMLLIENATTEASANVPFEIVEVVSVTNATTIAITRAVAGSTAATAVTGSFITLLGSVFAEGTGAPSSTSRNPVKLNNYTQIFKTSYEITRTGKNTALRTGDPLMNEKKRKSFSHSTKMEMAFLLNGAPTETAGGSAQPKRYTGSLRYFIQTNRTVFTATVTENSFIASLTPMFNFDAGGGNERLGFCGNGYLMKLNQLAKANTQVNTDQVVRLYGMELTKWIMPQGYVYLRTHPLLNTHARYTNSAFYIDGSALKYRPLRGGDTMFKDNIQLPDADAQKGQWIGETGLEVNHEITMAYHGNFLYP